MPNVRNKKKRFQALVARRREVHRQKLKKKEKMAEIVGLISKIAKCLQSNGASQTSNTR